MSSFLAMMLYIDYKCDTQPGFRKAFLVLTLIFVLFLWSPWRPFLGAAFGLFRGPLSGADSATHSKTQLPQLKHQKYQAPVRSSTPKP